MCMYVYVPYMYKWRAAALWRYNGMKTSTVYKEKPACSIQPRLCNRSRKHTRAQKIEMRRKYSKMVTILTSGSKNCVFEFFLIYMQMVPNLYDGSTYNFLTFWWYKSNMHSMEPYFEFLFAWLALCSLTISPHAGQWQWLSHGIPKMNSGTPTAILYPYNPWLSVSAVNTLHEIFHILLQNRFSWALY